jgi:hypothetical protein
MAVAVLGVAAMFPAAFRSVVTGGNMTKGAVFAQSATDMLRAEKFENLESYAGFDSATWTHVDYRCPIPDSVGTTHVDYSRMRMKCDVTPDGVQASGKGLAGGSVSIQVACVDPGGGPAGCSSSDLRRVGVTVSWDGGRRSASLVTYVARWE